MASRSKLQPTDEPRPPSTDATQPDISVVIPTYNRVDRLRRVLAALATQTTSAPFEVVVVSDGSSDGTNDYLRSGATPVPVVAVLQDNAGPAAARNLGLDTARGDLVLFIDDDVVPAADLVEQHLRAHRAAPADVVVIGPMLTPDDAKLSPWVDWEQHQLYKQYDAMRRGDYDCTFRQFFTGNASVPRQRVIDVGRFDTSFRRAEDVELSYRMHQAGVGFVFVSEARGFHYAERGFESWLATAFQYGRNDVTFIQEGQQWLTTTLPAEFGRRHLLVRSLTRYCVPRPRASRAALALLRRLGAGRWSFGPVRRLALSGLYNLNYYRGIADGLGSADRFLEFLDGGAGRDDRPRVAFVLEQTLGHVTHSQNLQRLLADSKRIHPAFLEVPFDVEGLPARVPGFGNWTVRAGVRARSVIRRQARRVGIDAMFIHTQVPAVLTGRWMRKIPTVVSLDATPIQYDELGEHYAHDKSSPRIETWKKRLNVSCFERARHLVVWSEWTRQGLIRDYGVEPGKVTVIAPGVDVERWARPSTAPPRGESPLVMLFVGGDLDRKGGRLLLDAARRLRADPTMPTFELHLVTRTDVDPEEGVVVHSNMTPNSDALIALYHRAEIFVLPTLGDCLPMVLSEAGVAELALVSTDVGAIREIVRDGETGLLIAPADGDALTDALARLLRDPDLRTRLATQAARLVRELFDAAANARHVEQLLIDVAAGNQPTMGASRRPVLLTVSGTIPADLDEAVAAGRRPRVDYLELAASFDADLLDYAEAARSGGRVGKLIGRALGNNAALAWRCFQLRRDYEVIVTDGEQVGLPFAALAGMMPRKGTAAHVMIAHILSVQKKVVLYRALRLGRRIDEIIVYATSQKQFIADRLGFPADRVTLSSFMVDTRFFSPSTATSTGGAPMICSAGLEFRDYTTMLRAVRGLDVRVVLAAASPWSKRASELDSDSLPANVEVVRLDLFQLRQLYADASLVVMPLHESDFQAGVTTLLEAMAMAKPIICSASTGQTDVIVEGETGRYVPVGDAERLRAAITELLDDPAEVRRLGQAARDWVVHTADLDVYVRGLAARVREHRGNDRPRLRSF